jgi:dienelactone hydrolase
MQITFTKIIRNFSLTFSFILFLTSSSIGQNKIPMDHSIYNEWKEISSLRISNDGSMITFEVNPQKGDGLLCIYNTENLNTDTVYRAYKAEFSSDSKFVVGLIKPFFEETRKAKKEKLKSDKMPHDSLFIYKKSSGEIIKFPNVSSFALAKEGSDWLAYQNYFKSVDDYDQENESDNIDKNETETDKKFNKIRNKLKPSDLTFYQPITSQSFRYENVIKYSLSENGQLGIFNQLVKDSIQHSVIYSFYTPDKSLDIIFESEGMPSKIAVDRKGTQASFTFSADSSLNAGYQLYSWLLGESSARVLIDSADSNLPLNYGISKYTDLHYSGSGERLFFGIAEIQEEREDSLLAEEKYSLDVWHWKDNYIQPQQKKELKKNREYSYRAFYDFKSERIVQLEKGEIRSSKSMYKDDGEIILGLASDKYGKYLSWEGAVYSDIYLLNAQNGDSSLILKKKTGRISISPFGNYILYFENKEGDWYVYDIENKESRNLTGDIDVSFSDELNDMPQDSRAYGTAGFSEDDESVLIYDRYDIWKIDPEMKEKPINITKGNGRTNKNVFRILKLDIDEIFVNLSKTLMLSCFNDENMQAGFASLDYSSGGNPEILIQTENEYPALLKAKKAEVFAFRKGDFKNYPDVFVSGPEFKDPYQVSEANPQANDYLWGDIELIKFKSLTGEELNGLFITPENMDPAKKYPVLVYFYERSSDRLYNHRIPQPSRSILSFPYCVSNGYIVFVPDIHYDIGHPGQSAYNSVVSGAQHIIDNYSFVDKNRIALQGQSWGGYQIAWLVTRTNMFKAAMAGAPVSNMTSAYGGVRWGTGLSRMFQYEKSQSRIGETLWENTDLYIENSPLFQANHVETPLLIMHNDNDGAVPWYQGIEYFLALRRLGKPVWMLSYNNEEHNLKNWPNRVDLSIRMMQFFDHYLKDAPMPEWMHEGLPAIEKGKKDAYDLME